MGSGSREIRENGTHRMIKTSNQKESVLLPFLYIKKIKQTNKSSLKISKYERQAMCLFL